MSDLECPYCKEYTDVPDECHNEDECYEATCAHCDKSFVFTLSYSVDYSSATAPCLNGESHSWQPIIGNPREYFENRRRCKWCDKEITVDKIEESSK